MKKILGLDLGTNSIGWAIVDESNIKYWEWEAGFFQKEWTTLGMEIGRYPKMLPEQRIAVPEEIFSGEKYENSYC
jgi:RNase H-fold protein (predicted Holliday junction resolvase)